VLPREHGDCGENTPHTQACVCKLPCSFGALLFIPVGIEGNPPSDIWWVPWLANPEHARVSFRSQPGFAGAWLGFVNQKDAA
jgi:hypothetical protein